MDGILGSDNNIRMLERELYGLARRQEAIGQNIANVDTPGYKALNVNFEDELVKNIARQNSVAMYKTDQAHLGEAPDSEMGVTYTRSSLGGNDLNSVDIDDEMVKLADTTIRYQAAARLISSKLAQLRTVVTEGRR